jgi:hypothetical protein
MEEMKEEVMWHRFQAEKVARGHQADSSGAGRRQRWLLIIQATGGRREGKWATGLIWTVNERMGGGLVRVGEGEKGQA